MGTEGFTMRIGDLAESIGTAVEATRFYEREG
jgi:DNA-binding transcriptional MerR regulator